MRNLLTRLFVLAIGLLFLLPAGYKLYTYASFRSRSVETIGVVGSHSRGRGLGGRPFVTYKDSRGITYDIKSTAKTHWFFAPRPGETLRVYYLENDPRTAIVDSTFHYIVFPLMLCSVGAAALIRTFSKVQ